MLRDAAVAGSLPKRPAASVFDRTPKRYHDITMAQILVRNLEDDVKARLQRRAKRHGHSTEAEVRDILRNAVRGEGARGGELGLGSRIAERFRGLGLKAGDLERLPPEEPRPVRFGK